MKVDTKGRVVLPKAVRERLGIDPGTEVTVREEDGRVVIEPEDDPEAIIDDLETMIASADASPTVNEADRDPVVEDHLETIRRGARSDDEDESKADEPTDD